MNGIQNSQLSTFNSQLILPGYKQTEVGVIPEDWEVKQIGDFRPFVTSGSRGWAEFYSDTGALFIRITNLVRDSIYLNLKDFRFVSLPADNNEGVRTQLREGDVLISITADIGIIGYISVKLPKPAYINQHIALVRFDLSVTNPKFVSYFLASQKPQRLFRALTDSGAKAGMNLTTVQQIRLALPPTLAEQQAIAEALSDADALIESLEQLLAKKRHIKQGAMQELLTGKKRLPEFGGEWEVKRLGEIATFFSGGTPSTAIVTYYYGGEIPWITSGDLNKSFVREVQGRITKEGLEKSSAKMIDINTLLVALYGATSGVTAISKIRAAINQAVLAIIPKNDNSLFLLYKLRHLKDWIINTYTQGGQPNLSGDIVKSIELVLPTVEEQTAIASILSDMDAEIAALEAKLAKTRQIKQGMMRELLTGKIRIANGKLKVENGE